MPGWRKSDDSKREVAEKLTQCQAVAHQVASPDIIDGLGARIEDKGSVLGSDIRQKKQRTYVTYSEVAAF